MRLLHSFRLPNVLLILITLWLVHFRLLVPYLQIYDLTPTLTSKEYLSFLFIVLCSSAGIYLHNDVVDIQSDSLNTKRGYISDKISHIILYLVIGTLLLAPLPIVYWLAQELGEPRYILLYLVVIGLLYIYNLLLKKTPLWGNITVAILCAVIVWLPVLAVANQLHFIAQIGHSSHPLFLLLLGSYSLFAFHTNLNREILKDMDDQEGDRHTGAKTIPIVMGEKWTISFVTISHYLLLFLITLWIIMLFYHFIPSIPIFINGLILISPGIYLIRIFKNSNYSVNPYYQMSQGYKLWMIAGIIYFLLISYSFMSNISNQL